MRIVLIITTFLFTSCFQKIELEQNTQQIQDKPKIIIPKRDDNLRLEKAANESAKLCGLEKLRDISLSKDNFEIRFWIASRTGLVGFVMKKNGDEFSANYVGNPQLMGNDKTENRSVEPKSNWQSVFQTLSDFGVFTLSDSSELKDYKGNYITDGFDYLVEINKDGIYRIYEYPNPNSAENPEAKQIIKISETIADEFNLEEFKINSK